MPLKVDRKQLARLKRNLKAEPVKAATEGFDWNKNPPWPVCHKCGGRWGSLWRPWGGETDVEFEHFGRCE